MNLDNLIGNLSQQVILAIRIHCYVNGITQISYGESVGYRNKYTLLNDAHNRSIRINTAIRNLSKTNKRLYLDGIEIKSSDHAKGILFSHLQIPSSMPYSYIGRRLGITPSTARAYATNRGNTTLETLNQYAQRLGLKLILK